MSDSEFVGDANCFQHSLEFTAPGSGVEVIVATDVLLTNKNVRDGALSRQFLKESMHRFTAWNPVKLDGLVRNRLTLQKLFRSITEGTPRLREYHNWELIDKLVYF